MKDPAFLFYSSDFLTGTMLMSDEQVGQYIKLLCILHQKESLKESEIIKICGKLDPDIMQKLSKNEDGTYYNKRLKTEMENRTKFKEKQRENGSKGGRPKNPKETQKKPNKKPNESTRVENENINVIKNVIEYLNLKTDRKYSYKAKSNQALIVARINEGRTLEDFKKVIDNKVTDWLKDDYWNEYLRPETLFSNKFDGYLNKTVVKKAVSNNPFLKGVEND